MAPKDDLSRSETIFDRFREAVVLAKSLNFNVASALLHISQPTLTRHIANLERELGFKLFTRFPMALTPEGQYFIAATEKLIADYDKVIAQCRDMAKRSQEAIVINMVFASSSLWGNLVHHAVSQFHGRHPELPMPCFFQNRAIPIDASVFRRVRCGNRLSRTEPLARRLRVPAAGRVPLGGVLFRRQPPQWLREGHLGRSVEPASSLPDQPAASGHVRWGR